MKKNPGKKKNNKSSPKDFRFKIFSTIFQLFRNNVRLTNLLNDLEKVCKIQSIPQFYSYFFILAIKAIPSDKLELALTKQIKNIKTKQSFYHELNRSINARQSCILQMKKCLEGIDNLRQFKNVKLSQDANSQLIGKKLKTLQQQLNHYRKLTLYIIEKIRKWRDYLRQINQNQLIQNPLFLYKEENYLMKILNDTNFVSNSILSQYVNLALKNDPFLLKPLKSSKTQLNARFYELFEVDEDLKKKMLICLDYLATEKAQELNNRFYNNEQRKEKQFSKNSNLKYQKQKKKSIVKEFNYQTDFDKKDDYRSIQKQKQRIERLQKNQQRINAIKSIYESKKLLMGNTDTQNQVIFFQPKKLIKQSKQPIRQQKFIERSKSLANGFMPKGLNRKNQQQSQFDNILRNKQIQILKEGKSKNVVKDRFANRKKFFQQKEGLKELQKMINGYNSVKNVQIRKDQQDVKNKIQLKNEEDNLQNSNIQKIQKNPQNKGTVSINKGSASTGLKQNQELIKELKNEILQKLQKQTIQKEKIKKQHRLQQEKLIENMKQKLKIEVQDKIKQQKRRKEFQKQMLQKKLTQQQKRIAKQKYQQKELQIKLTREKQSADMEKIKKNLFEKEKNLQEQFSYEQKNRKNNSIQEVPIRIAKSKVEQELLKETRQKMQRDVNKQLYSRDTLQKIKNNKNEQLELQLKKLKIKETLQIEQMKRQNEIKDKMLKSKLQQQELKRIQLEKLIKFSMENQKKELEKFAYQKRKQMQNELRQTVKQKLLFQMRNDKIGDYQRIKKDEYKDIEQEIYRSQLKEKLQKQMKIQVTDKMNKQFTEKEIKKKDISAKLQSAQKKLQEKIYMKPFDKDEVQKDIKKQIIEKTIVERKIQKEIAKNQLRLKFQKELLTSGFVPANTQNQDYLLNHLNSYRNSNFFSSRLEQQKQNRQRQSNNKIQLFNQEAKISRLQLQQSQQIQKIEQENSPDRYSFGLLSQIPNSPEKNRLGIFTQFPQSQDKTNLNSFTVYPVSSPQKEENQIIQVKDMNNTNNQLIISKLKYQKSNNLGMTPEQYEIYMKKKNSLNNMRKDIEKSKVQVLQNKQFSQEQQFKVVRIKGQQQLQKLNQIMKSEKKLEKHQQSNKNKQKMKQSSKKKYLKQQQQRKQKRKKKEKKIKKQEESDYQQDQSKEVSSSEEQKIKKKSRKKKKLDSSEIQKESKKKEKKRKRQEIQQIQSEQQQIREKKKVNKKKKKQESQSEQEYVQKKKKRKVVEQSSSQENTKKKKKENKKKKIQQQQQSEEQQKKPKKKSVNQKKKQTVKKQFQTSQSQTQLAHKKKEKNKQQLSPLKSIANELKQSQLIIPQNSKIQIKQEINLSKQPKQAQKNQQIKEKTIINTVQQNNVNNQQKKEVIINNANIESKETKQKQIKKDEKNVNQTKEQIKNKQSKDEKNFNQTKESIKTNKQSKDTKSLNQTKEQLKPKQKQKIQIDIDAIDQGDLNNYLKKHFSLIPKDQLDILIYDKQQLSKKLLNEIAFSLFIGKLQNKNIGLCIAHHERNKQEVRKFVITHISTYNTENHFEFIITMCNYIFRKDPCDQIEFLFQYDQSIEQQLQFNNKFNTKFDKYGTIFQKKIEDQLFQRKYVMKRPFNLKCQVSLGTANKQNFSNLCTFSSSMLFSNLELYQNKEENLLKETLIPQREISYAIMICEIFRSCLSPQEADILKTKVKEILKLKQLLILVVMLEKKKIKLEELKISEYKNIVDLNMKLFSQGKQLIKMVKDSEGAINKLFFCEFNQSFKLPFHFQTTTLPIQEQNITKHINYFRMSSLGQNKLYIIKSSLYNAEMHILPTQNSKYKLFLMSASQYNEIKVEKNLDLFMYIRVFLKNVKSHNAANWKHIWIPQISTKGHWAIRQFRSYLNKDIFTFDSINISYKQFIPGSLMIQPDHKDLVITPPFIVGILSNTMQQVSEGSPLYVRLLESDSLKIIEVEQN